MSDLIDRQKAIDAILYATDGDLVAQQAAVEALEQLEAAQADHSAEVSKMDCISRQDAIKALLDELAMKPDDEGLNRYDVEDVLRGLPSAQPEPQWIPCSEGLPVIETDVLLTSYDGERMYVGWIDAFGTWYGEDGAVVDRYEPIAWMPLPEPWKGEAND